LPRFAFAFLFGFSVAVAGVPAPEKLIVFLLAGQSNMAGRGAVEPTDRMTDPRIFVWHDDQWVPASEPLHRDKPAVAGVGPGLAFARSLLPHLPAEAAIGLVPAAFGGTKLEWWGKAYSGHGQRWPDGSTLYANAIMQTKRAVGHGRVAGVLWNQGESDVGTIEQGDGAVYRRRLHTLIADLRADLDTPDLPFVAATLGPWRKDDAAKLNAIVLALPSEVPHTAVVNTSAPEIAGRLHRKPDDPPHYDAASARLLGELYAEMIRSLLR
jgi:hypothetical protein